MLEETGDVRQDAGVGTKIRTGWARRLGLGQGFGRGRRKTYGRDRLEGMEQKDQIWRERAEESSMSTQAHIPPEPEDPEFLKIPEFFYSFAVSKYL